MTSYIVTIKDARGYTLAQFESVGSPCRLEYRR